MPPSIGEPAEGAGVFFDGAAEGFGDCGVAEVDWAGDAFAFAVVAFAGGADFFCGVDAFGAAVFFSAGFGCFTGGLFDAFAAFGDAFFAVGVFA